MILEHYEGRRFEASGSLIEPAWRAYQINGVEGVMQLILDSYRGSDRNHLST
jgi:hypothetical protein